MASNSTLICLSSTVERSRKNIRRTIRQLRQALSMTQQQQAAWQLANRVISLPLIQQATHCALFFSFDHELNTQPLIASLWQQQKSVYLPVLHPFRRGYLIFLHYTLETPMYRNHFGILEPKWDLRHLLPLSRLDILFTPLVAFDKQGNRLGMGGGFYDRLLQGWQQAYAAQQGPYPIGLAHDCQKVIQLPIQPWDIPLPEIVTPSMHYCWH